METLAGRRVPLAICASVLVLCTAWLAATGAGAHVRPKSAPIIKVPLVPSFNACASPNRQHGPPLAFPSCNPPVATSNSVTVGTEETNGAGDNSVGNFKLKVQGGVPGPPEDSDVLVTGSITDVRCKGATTACGSANGADGPDYNGGLQGSSTLRITDRWSAVSSGGGPDPSTVVDIPFPFPFACVATADTTVGSTCSSNTSMNAVVPLAIRDGKRSVFAWGQFVISDGGPDGSTSTTPNTNFMREGVFVP